MLKDESRKGVTALNFNRRIDNRVGVAVLVVALVAGGGYIGLKQLRSGGQADAEVKAQEPEIAECKKRLQTFYDAWKQYRADHKNQDPPSVESLIPKYIKDPSLLVCPTAERWQKQKMMFAEGSLTIGGKQYPESYGFKWLSAGYPKFVKKYGDKVALVECDVHKHALYVATYRRKPKPDAFDSDKTGQLLTAVRDSPTLAVRRSGTVEPLGVDEQR